MQQRLTNLYQQLFSGDKLLATLVVTFLVGLPIFLTVVLSNTEEEPTPTSASIVEPVAEPVTEPVAEPEPVKPAPINLSGSGQMATDKFTLQPGLAVFKMTHSGSEHFGIWLYDSNGETIELLVNDTGNFNGSKAVQIPAAGEYLLDVSAGGPWTVTIEQ